MALFVAAGLPQGHSVVFNEAWITQYIDAISWSNPLPRWLPGLWAGFGGHDFFFYAPLPFWLGASSVAPLCGTCTPATVLTVTCGLFLIASGWTMFAFLRSMFHRQAATAGAIAYMILPYHLLVDWFLRQAVGEFIAFAFLPLVALGMERLRRDEGGGSVLALGVAGLCLSHLPTALLAGHVFAVVGIFLALAGDRRPADRLRILGSLSLHGGLGLALAAFYWLPAIVLLDNVSPDLLFTEYFEASKWLYPASLRDPVRGFALFIIPCLACAAPIILAALPGGGSRNRVWVALPAGCALILNLSISEPIWQEWVIARVQFPWRPTSFIEFSTAVALAALVANVRSRRSLMVLASVLILSAVPYTLLATAVLFQMRGSPLEQTEIDWRGAVEYLSPEMTKAIGAYQYRNEPSDTGMEATTRAFSALAQEFRSAHRSAETLDRRPRSFSVSPAAGASDHAIAVQYWHLWRAEDATGVALEIQPDPRFGTLRIMAPTGGFTGQPVTLRLPFQRSEQMGLLLSILALLAMAARWIVRRKAAT